MLPKNTVAGGNTMDTAGTGHGTETAPPQPANVTHGGGHPTTNVDHDDGPAPGGDEAFDQLLVQQGPSEQMAGHTPLGLPFGVEGWTQRLRNRKGGPLPEGVEAPTYVPDIEYIAQFEHQNAILRRIYDALVGRARPAEYVRRIDGNYIAQRLRVRTLVLSNPGVAATVTLTVGVTPWPFAMLASQTLVLPFPVVIEAGLTVALDHDAAGYIVGDLINAEGG
jgi:hypothetical protein